MMRGVALALVSAGIGTALAGAVLGVAAWQGQAAAKVKWEARATYESPADPTTQELTHLSFPAQDAEFFVWEGASTRNLLFGPARVAESAVPGGRGNCIIAAHRDTHFRILKEVRQDEEVLLERGGRTFRYRITGLHIVPASDTSFYRPTEGSTLTLVTCYPFSYLGKAPKRFIVQAELLAAGT